MFIDHKLITSSSQAHHKLITSSSQAHHKLITSSSQAHHFKKGPFLFLIVMLFFMSNLFSETILSVPSVSYPDLNSAIQASYTLNDDTIVIEIESGTYDFNETFNISFNWGESILNNLTIRGIGVQKPILNFIIANTTTFAYFFQIDGAGSAFEVNLPSLSFENLTIQSNIPNNSSLSDIYAFKASGHYESFKLSDIDNISNSKFFYTSPTANSYPSFKSLLMSDCHISRNTALESSYNSININFCRSSIVIDSCTFSNSGNIYLESRGDSSIEITNCHFDTQIDYNGSIYILEPESYSTFSTYVTIKDNNFLNQMINIQGAHASIKNNNFNNLINPTVTHTQYSFINIKTPANNITSTDIHYNYFENASYDRTPIRLDVYNNSIRYPFNISSNSFINCYRIIDVIYPENFTSVSPIYGFKNNLFYNYSQFLRVQKQLNNGGNINGLIGEADNADYCYFTSPFPSNYLTDLNQTCIVGIDPLITLNPTDHTYTLNWSATQKSPLIMNGYYSELIGQTADTTWDRDDIGAVQYSGDPHSTRKYVLPPATQNSGIKWMSFPIVDSLYNPSVNDPDYAANFFLPILYTSQIEYIKSKYQNQNENEIKYEDGEWQNTDYTVTPIIGHKIKVNSTYNQYQSFLKSAHKPNVNSFIPLFALKQGTLESNENWIGYFCETTKSVQNAFGSFFTSNTTPYIYSIQHQNWTAYRKNHLSPWTIAIPMGQSATLKYGDMVIVKCSADMPYFTWTPLICEPIDEYVRAQTSYYQYEEKADYIPIYASFSTEEMPSEIAVFIDNECKGAAVVNSNLVEIPAYIVDDIENNPELEIRMYYDSKNAVTIPNTAFFNEDTQTYTSKLKVTEKKDCFNVRIGKDTPLVDLEYSIRLSNYPNPFNPSTTLNYQIAESGDIKMTIYNVKGQLVKSIYNGYQEKGTYQMVWDGKDDNNTNVASGIYYASLKTAQKSIVKKMLLMK